MSVRLDKLMPVVQQRLRSLTIFLMCFAAQVTAFASGPGTSAANFLKIPVGARGTSLGGAFTAVADNADAVFYNPAGLGLLAVPEFSYAFNNYLPGVSQQWLAAAYPAARGTLGLGVNYLSVKAFDSYDASDNRTGSVSAYDLAFHLGYGGALETDLEFLPSLRYGAAVKYISERLDTSKASGYGVDAGLLLLTPFKALRFGLGLENLAASRLDFIRGGAKPPFKLKTGMSYRLGAPGKAVASLFSLDYNFPEDGPRYLAAGIESTVYGALALRAGYSSFGEISNGVSFGLGFGLPVRGGREIRLDYSYGATPKVEFFTDRVEITSMGSLPYGVEEEDFFSGFSIPRNKEIMRVFRDLEIVPALRGQPGRLLHRGRIPGGDGQPHGSGALYRPALLR